MAWKTDPAYSESQAVWVPDDPNTISEWNPISGDTRRPLDQMEILKRDDPLQYLWTNSRGSQGKTYNPSTAMSEITNPAYTQDLGNNLWNITGGTLDSFKEMTSKLGIPVTPELQQRYEQLVRNNNPNPSGGFLQDVFSTLPYLGIMAGIGGFAGGAGAFGLDSSSAMAGLDSGAGLWGSPAATGAGTAAATGGNVADLTDIFNYTPEFNYGNLSGINPGDFTSSMLPGGDLSAYGGTGGMVDLGGAGAVAGVNVGGVQSLLGPLTQKIGEQAAKSLLGRVLNGTATTEDYANIAGKLGAAALQALGSNQQSKSLSDLAARYQEYGAPSRSRFEASMTPGFDPMSIPGYSGALDTASKSILARLSAQNGNPFGNPGGLIEANKAIVSGTAMPAINEYQRLNANTGFGSSMNAALGLQTGAIGADNNVLAGIASGLGSLTAPTQDNSLASLLKQLKDSGFNWNTGTQLA